MTTPELRHRRKAGVVISATADDSSRTIIPRGGDCGAAATSTTNANNATATTTTAANATSDDGGVVVPAATTTTTSPAVAASEEAVVDPGRQRKAASLSSLLSMIRGALFPIYGRIEITKFCLLCGMKFFIILALVLSRDTKDTLVVTACGAESIAFLKVYGVLPAATLFIAWYGTLANVLNNNKQLLFYVTAIPFFVFFLAFDVLMYPNQHVLHPSQEWVQSVLRITSEGQGGGGGGGFWMVLSKIVSNWTFAVFYVVSELYASVSTSLLFWQLANDIVPVEQAKRFYPLFAQVSGVAPLLAGQYMARYTSAASTFQQSMHRLTAAITASGCGCVLFFTWIVRFVRRTQPETAALLSGQSDNKKENNKKKAKKPKLTTRESIQFLASSPYLRLVATLVLGYGLSINFTDLTFKSLLKKQYPHPLDYQRFMGNFSSAVGASTCVVILIGVQIIRLLGWRIGAVASPAIMAVLAAPFFACIVWGTETQQLHAGGTMLTTAVAFGAVNSLLSKTAKYALFDPTTQMAYIPLDEESKVKGKAAIDVLGSRIGKSGGSLVQQGLVVAFGNILSAAPVLAALYYAVLLAWMRAAHKLSKLFAEAQQQQQQQQQQQREQEELDRKNQ